MVGPNEFEKRPYHPELGEEIHLTGREINQLAVDIDLTAQFIFKPYLSNLFPLCEIECVGENGELVDLVASYETQGLSYDLSISASTDEATPEPTPAEIYVSDEYNLGMDNVLSHQTRYYLLLPNGAWAALPVGDTQQWRETAPKGFKQASNRVAKAFESVLTTDDRNKIQRALDVLVSHQLNVENNM